MTAPPDAVVKAPPAPTRADRAAAVAVVALPVLGLVAKLLVPGLMALALLMWFPVLVAVYGVGVLIHTRALGRRSVVLHGHVPRRYRVLAWTWAVAMSLPGFVVLDFADDSHGRSALTELLGVGAPPDAYTAAQDVVLVACAVVALAAPLAVVLLRRRDARS